MFNMKLWYYVFNPSLDPCFNSESEFLFVLPEALVSYPFLFLFLPLRTIFFGWELDGFYARLIPKRGPAEILMLFSYKVSHTNNKFLLQCLCLARDASMSMMGNCVSDWIVGWYLVKHHYRKLCNFLTVCLCSWDLSEVWLGWLELLKVQPKSIPYLQALTVLEVQPIPSWLVMQNNSIGRGGCANWEWSW